MTQSFKLTFTLSFLTFVHNHSSHFLFIPDFFACLVFQLSTVSTILLTSFPFLIVIFIVLILFRSICFLFTALDLVINLFILTGFILLILSLLTHHFSHWFYFIIHSYFVLLFNNFTPFILSIIITIIFNHDIIKLHYYIFLADC